VVTPILVILVKVSETHLPERKEKNWEFLVSRSIGKRRWGKKNPGSQETPLQEGNYGRGISMIGLIHQSIKCALHFGPYGYLRLQNYTAALTRIFQQWKYHLLRLITT